MSDNTRAAVYSVMAAVLGLLTTVGYVTADEASSYAAAGGQTLAALALVMAAVKTAKQSAEKKAAPPAE